MAAVISLVYQSSHPWHTILTFLNSYIFPFYSLLKSVVTRHIYLRLASTTVVDLGQRVLISIGNVNSCNLSFISRLCVGSIIWDLIRVKRDRKLFLRFTTEKHTSRYIMLVQMLQYVGYLNLNCRKSNETHLK